MCQAIFDSLKHVILLNQAILNRNRHCITKQKIKLKLDRLKKNVRYVVCDMSDRYVESSGTPVVILRFTTINDVLSVMFGYCLKVEEQKVFGCDEEKM